MYVEVAHDKNIFRQSSLMARVKNGILIYQINTNLLNAK